MEIEEINKIRLALHTPEHNAHYIKHIIDAKEILNNFEDIIRQNLTTSNGTEINKKVIKKYVVGVISFYENELKLFNIEALNRYEAVKKSMLEYWDDEEVKRHELEWQQTDDYPKDYEGLVNLYWECSFDVLEIT